MELVADALSDPIKPRGSYGRDQEGAEQVKNDFSSGFH
jgi:hypothetical protein